MRSSFGTSQLRFHGLLPKAIIRIRPRLADLERRLIDKTLTILQYPHQLGRVRLSPKESAHDHATLITEFSHIYYYLTGKRSLG